MPVYAALVLEHEVRQQRVRDTIYGPNAFLQPAIVRTFVYVLRVGLICLVIGYAVAYYVARYRRQDEGRSS